MSLTIVVASKNKGKIAEFNYEFSKIGIEVKSLHDYPEIPDIIEDGHSFIDNAKIKAKVTGELLQLPVLSDDSGLTVNALDGAPGIYSARYAGEGATDHDNNIKLVQQLMSKGARHSLGQLEDGSILLSDAQFRCALALYIPQGQQFIIAEGHVDGVITDQARGDGGFGYDPYFYLPQLSCSVAELSKEEKGEISHRGAALKQLIPAVERYLKQ